eukprot:GFYU01000777.1.p2 GENE.GFYU01000777.1~~GFYU01000777.1.p2  ORF type:complete len:169 (-),score=38.43 GFYU01000777.1:64-570(-)
MKVLAAITLFALVAVCSAHPTLYPDVDPLPLEYFMETGEVPPFRSYHIHIMFMHKNQKRFNETMALRDRFIEQFNLGDEKLCEGLFDQGRLCMFDPDLEAAGPFPTGQWSVYVPIEWFAKTVPWIMQNRGDFDLLVHPNTGHELPDHTAWAMWGGEKWFLDTTIFSSP